ncbi:MAG: hypothetical protein IT384_08905 [Deltaproteobacteria bacterium]|nr:hypothetical protein [Deltaproteobacteria bacterium]
MRATYLWFSLALVSCTADTAVLPGGDSGRDARPDDAAPGDATPADARPRDGAPEDVEGRDAEPRDAELRDADPSDEGLRDAGPPAECRLPTIPNSPLCGPAACGNGVIDRCEQCNVCSRRPAPDLDAGTAGAPFIPPPTDGGCCALVQEECDGVSLGNTCTSLGWAGGRVSCNGFCSINQGECTSCAVSGATCRDGDVDGRDPIAMDAVTDASGTHLIVAWVTSGATSARRGGLHLADYGPSLSTPRVSPCVGPIDATDIAITTLDGALLLAIGQPQGILIATYDGATQTWMDRQTIPGAYQPHFARGRTDRAVLTYGSSGSGLMARALNAQGASRWTTAVLTDVVEPEFTSAVFVGDAVLIAARSGSFGVSAVQISAGGQLGLAQALDTRETEYPQLAAIEGDTVAATWTRFGTGEVVWATLNSIGQPSSAVTRVSGLPVDFNSTPMVAANGRIHALLGGYTGTTGLANRLALTELTAPGTPPVEVARAAMGLRDHRILTVGSSIVMAWIAPGIWGRVGVAALPR